MKPSDQHPEDYSTWAVKYQSDSPITLRAFVAVALFSLVAVFSGIGYLKQKEHTDQIGEDIKQMETAIENLQLKNRLKETEIERLKSPQRLEKIIQEWDLKLAPPKEGQILRFGDPNGPDLQNPDIQLGKD
jgi:hypothetical protein